MAVVIAKCTCKHEYQDAKYGNRQRVKNTCEGKYNLRCTVCGKEDK